MENEEQISELSSLYEHAQLAGAATQSSQHAQSAAASQYYVEEKEKGLAEAQLDCDKTLQDIYHLLRQDVLRPSDDGTIGWQPVENQMEKALTDTGVDRIMQMMRSYVNKETLLSNFDDIQINRRMLEFAYALNANMFMKYEIYFRKPTFEECVGILNARLGEKEKVKIYAREALGLKADKVEIKKEVLKEIEDRIEYEIIKIRQERIRQNLREYELLFVQLKAIIEATHNRAWKGEERGSLRRHTNISEIIGNRMPMPKSEGGMFKWLKG